MPLRKKKDSRIRNILIWSAVAILLILILISFSPSGNVTEIVLYP